MSYSIGTVTRDRAPVSVIAVDDVLYHIAAASHALLGRAAGEAPVMGLLQNWERASEKLAELAELVAAGKAEGHRIERHDGWLPPVLHPRKVIGIGANYKDHLDFAGIPYPTTPYLFLKPASTTLLGSGQTLVIPREVEQADWEGELAAVIGRPARRVSEADALECVAGYTVANDFSARDWLANAIPPLGSDWLLHKGWDGFTPLGPLITPAQFVADPQSLRITLDVDGIRKQDGTTANMVFTVAQLIAHASSIMTLEPGDVLLTGTPMGAGFAREPKERLEPGQTMVVEVEGLGVLTTPTVAE
jgi:2-keto-4-pentenoate hydratase/2-oxohepta-3-ene-1,7-dioic acid hydratase in catechol pathway